MDYFHVKEMKIFHFMELNILTVIPLVCSNGRKCPVVVDDESINPKSIALSLDEILFTMERGSVKDKTRQ